MLMQYTSTLLRSSLFRSIQTLIYCRLLMAKFLSMFSLLGPECSLKYALLLFWGGFKQRFLDLYMASEHATFRIIRYVPSTQYGHSKCALLTFPHAEHLFNAVTSFKAFPAYCLCLFFICEVFFFGTALSIDSQIPSTKLGRFNCIAEGRANPSEGMRGCESCRE